MTSYRDLVELAAEIDSSVARLRAARPPADTTTTDLAGGLGRVVVDGRGALVAVELAPGRLHTVSTEQLGGALVAAVHAAEEAAGERLRAALDRAADEGAT